MDISIYEMQIKIYQTCDKHGLALFCYFIGKIAKKIFKNWHKSSNSGLIFNFTENFTCEKKF